ncbi:ATP-dependent nuclease [Clostridium tunisiense]|uniref:ATP-dependent nuclease n=1 Tax=Clostridium tunisiense TaxID=219748 RepID=UPI0003002BC3|nr:AAA family ATPase [Clostridium tunisiense]
MKFENLQISNFRNFKNINIKLDNKNVIFGMNDVGKTNFLCSLRFLLDKEVRKNGFLPTDYHKNNIKEKIEITLTLDLSDFDQSEDTKKFVSETRDGWVRNSQRGDIFYIRVEGEFDEKEVFGEPIMKWGDDLQNLKDIPFKGTSYAIDNIFKLVYIDPLIDLERLFEKNKRYIFNENSNTEGDKQIIRDINALTDEVNKQIGKMTTISSFQAEITEEYKKLKKESIKIEMKSEMAVKGFFSDIIPYIKRDGDENHYPTSGDGRRKMLSYSLFNYLNKKKYEDKVVVYLLEEPENNFHRSMQIALSKQFFEEDIYKYIFISTHSSEILYEMDKAMLIRIHSQDKIECDSYLYRIDSSYKITKKKLNKELSNALFAEKVLLIEGPSEKILFEKVLDEVNPEYELNGGYILQVTGTHFKPYFEVLNGLDIETSVKTDNDLKNKKGTSNEYELLGLNRCLELLNKSKLDNIQMPFDSTTTKKDKHIELKNKKQQLYTSHESLITELKKRCIYLSEVDLENDLFSVIGERMAEILEKPIDKVVDYMQDKKLLNMVELVEGLTKDDCIKIYESDKFNCLRELS